MTKKKNRRRDDAPQIPAGQVEPKPEDSVDASRAAGAQGQSTLDAFAEAGAGVAAKE